MALRYGYFDSEIVGVDDEGMPVFDRAETSDLFALLFASLISDGVLALPRNCFQVLGTGKGMKVEIQPGFGMVRGHFAWDNEKSELDIRTAPQKYSRIDRVVMRCNYLERMVEIVVKTGAEAAKPVPPALVRPAAGDYYELCLADIRLTAGQKNITQSSITDRRPDSSVCGYITQLIDHLDTAVFFAQFDSFYQEFVEKSNTSYEKFRKMAQDAYNSLSAQMESYLNSLEESGNRQMGEIIAGGRQKYEEFKAEIISYISELKAKGDTDLAELLQEFLDFRNENEEDFLSWFEGIRDVLAAAENGTLLAHIEHLLEIMYDVGTPRDIDSIINGTYRDEEDGDNGFWEVGTKQDIDGIIGGTYLEEEPEDVTHQKIQEIVDKSFGEV